MGLDIGKRAISSFEELETAKTILWNGPMGVSEYDKFAAGTEVQNEILFSFTMSLIDVLHL